MKDVWDKLEVCSKAAGAVLVPTAVAVSVYSFNSNTSERATAAQMTGIAIAVLSEDPDNSAPSSALRTWAIAVLRAPGQITPLSEAAAELLYVESIPAVAWKLQNVTEPSKMPPNTVE